MSLGVPPHLSGLSVPVGEGRRGVTFVAFAFGLLTALTADAQPTHKVWRVGLLGDGPRAERASISIGPFRDGLRELGYIENQNVVIEERWSDGRSELRTAKALGLTVPADVLARADEVIQ